MCFLVIFWDFLVILVLVWGLSLVRYSDRLKLVIGWGFGYF